ncbi:hypothetical protein KVF89_12885 [Nocardioides carbamazepini]|uniref:hypothetical protein n=1 Tax=Nocardioides carbamazepini TaxID=2854259 RepID=UPI00214A5F54|nr:hypothetical protein [Nocardioides carbamazepini]MCR1783431.1 hypothetical protein [Nocardioides carbamazepini]
MSLPPPPPAGPPPSGPPQGPPQGPPSGPPSGWGPPAYPPYGPPSGRPPRRRNVGLVVGLVALAVVLLAAIGVGAFLVAGGGDDGDRTADDRTTGDASSEATSETTEPTSEPTSPNTSATPTEVPTSVPSAPYTPSDDTDDDIHNDVKAADFPGDWDFKLGDVEHHATLVRSVDQPSCAPVEEGNVLTRQRCQYAVQWVFDALGGKVRLTHLFLVFDTERHAKAAQGTMKDKDFDLPADSTLPSFAAGKWNSGVYGNIVAVTIGTAKAGVAEKRLTSLVNYMNTDFKSALLFTS